MTIPLTSGGEVFVGDDQDGSVDVTVTGEEGEEANFTVEGETEGGVEELVAVLTDGEWDVQTWSEEEGQSWSEEEWFAEEDAATVDPEDSDWSDGSGSGDSGSVEEG